MAIRAMNHPAVTGTGKVRKTPLKLPAAHYAHLGAFAVTLFGVLALGISFAYVMRFSVASGPSNNRMIAYQLRLTDTNGVLVGGSKNLKITFFDADTAGNQLYTYCATTDSPTGTPESFPVTFTNGIGTILIGDTSISCNNSGFEQGIPANLFSNTGVYMELEVEGETLSPRKRLVASGYALNADLLDDLDTSFIGGSNAYVPVTDGSGNLTLTADFTVDSPTFFVDSANNRIGVGTVTPNEQLELTGNLRLPVTGGSTAGVLYSGADRFMHAYGTENVFLGANAGNFTTTSDSNVGIGVRALSAMTSGTQNTAIGWEAMSASSSGASSYAVAIGFQALRSNGNIFNTAVGYQAMRNNGVGGANTAVGLQALMNNTNGGSNSAVGVSSLFSNTGGGNNAAIGRQALYANTSGSGNTGLGYSAGNTNTSGSNNTFIGNNSDATVNNLTNATAIGYNAQVSQNNSLVLGGTGADAVKVGIGTASPITQLHVPGTVPAAAVGSVATDTGPVWVDVQDQYAYVVNFGVLFGPYGNTLKIYDISDPMSPELVGTATTKTAPYSVSVQGKYAYVTNFKFNATDDSTLEIFDVSDPTDPVSVGSAVAGLDAMSVFVQGNYAYVGSFTSNWRFNVFDVSDPTNPVRVGTAAESTGGLGTVWGLFVQGDYLYATHQTADNFSVYDVSDPTSPARVATIGSGDGVTDAPSYLYVQDSYAYVTSENTGDLQIIDVSDPAAPVVRGSVNTGGSTAYGVEVRGRYAYVANYGGNKFALVDVSDPTAPTLVGTVSTDTNPQGLAVQGRYAYVTNYGSATLQVFDLGGSYIQQLEAGDIQTGELAAQNGIETSEADVHGGLTVGRSAKIGEDLGVGGTADVIGSLSIGSDGLVHSGNLITPNGGFGRYENLLTYSEQLDNTAWTATGVSVTADSAAAPDGTTTAELIADDATAGGDVTQSGILASPGDTFTLSVWVKNNDTDRNIRIRIQDDGTVPDETYITFRPTASWHRYTVTHTASAGSAAVSASIVDLSGDLNPAEINNSFYAWGAQLEKQSSAGVYARTEGVAITTARQGLNTPFISVGTSSAFQVNSSGDIQTLGDLAVNGGDITTSTASFNLAAGADIINIVGGSGSTGCTIDVAGNLACSGSVSGSGGSGGWSTGSGTVYLATSTDKVGVGTSTPLGVMHIVTESATSMFYDRYGGAPPNIIFRRANGTAALPTAVGPDNQLFAIGGRGYGATGFSSGGRAAVFAAASENWTDSAQGAYLAFTTTENGTATAAERLRISDAGNVGIGLTTPSYSLDIAQVNVDADRAINLAVSADTDGDDVYGIYNTVDVGTGTLASPRNAYGIYNDLSMVATAGTPTDVPALYGIYNTGTNSAAWGFMGGVRNVLTSTGSTVSQVRGIDNTIRAEGNSASSYAWGMLNGISSLGNGSVAFGVDNNLYTGNDSNAQTVYGIRARLATYAGAADVAYGYYVEDTVGNSSTGGTQYGLYVNIDDPDVTNYGVYEAGGATNYFAGDIGIGTSSPSSFNLQVAGDIGPDADDTYDLGSSTLRWRDLYLGPASLHIGTNGDEAVISYDTATDRLNIDKDLAFSGGGLSVENGNLASPFGGFGTYVNHLVYSEQFNQGSKWVPTGVTVTADNTMGPDGLVDPSLRTADRINAGAGATDGVTQTVSPAPMLVQYSNATWTFSVWMKAASGTPTVTLVIDGNGTSEPGSVAVTIDTEWHRYALTHTFTTGTGSPVVTIQNGTNAIYAWGAQLEFAAATGLYAKTEGTPIASNIAGTPNSGLVGNGSLLFYGSDGETPMYGDGTRMMWIPAKSAFRAGYGGSNWNDGYVGLYSTAFGSNTRANGYYSFAGGNQSIASSTNSFAFGAVANSTGFASVAMGSNANATNSSAIALGGNTFASGGNAIAIGADVYASYVLSTAIGHYLNANADYAMVFGNGVDNSNKLTNSIGNSLMVGFNSRYPTLFVGPSNGGTTTGPVGVGVWSNLTKLTVKQSVDEADIGGVTVSDTSGTTITGSGTEFTKRLGIGDRVALSSAPTTYATVVSITSDTLLTVDTALSDGDGETIRAKHGMFRVDDSSDTTKLFINDLGNVGLGTISPSAKLGVTGGTVLFDGTTGSTPVSGAGTRFMWIPDKQAIRAGMVQGTQWDAGNIGLYSAAFGQNTQASGQRSFAAGYYSSASAESSTALGYNNSAAGWSSVAAGEIAWANGTGAVALGSEVTAGANYSFAVGQWVTASGTNSVIIGHGISNASRITNSVANSLAVGFNSTIPTLVVGPGSGAGTLGNVGIGDSTPASLFTVGNDDRFQVTSLGDIISDFTTSYALDGAATDPVGSGSGTSMTVTSATNYTIGNYIKLVNPTTNCSGSNTTCYAKITNVAGNILTISPSLVWDDTATVTEWHVPEIGAQNEASPVLEHRFGRGYFLDGIAVGNGTTYFTDQGILDSSGSTLLSLDSSGDVSFDGNVGFGTSSPNYALEVANSTLARSVNIENTYGTGATYGVYVTDSSIANGSAAVYGTATGASGATYGVYGSASSSGGIGVHGTSSYYGVSGTASGNGTGVYGLGAGSGAGVRGTSTSTGTGVWGQQSNTGSGSYYGVKGDTSATGGGAAGVYGNASGASGAVYGVKGTASSSSGYGGYFSNSGAGAGLYASSSSGYAAIFDSGNVGIGTTSPTTQLDVYGRVPSAYADTAPTCTGAVGIKVQDRYAYVTCVQSPTGQLQILDISDPTNMTQVSQTVVGSLPYGLAVQGHYAYVVNYGSNTLQVLDVSDPTSPSSLGSVATGSGPYYLDVSGKYAYVINFGSATLQIFDVTDPVSPTSVGSVSTGGGTQPRAVYVQDGYAYVITTTGVLQVYDVSNPSSPSLAGSVTVSSGGTVRGVWVQGTYAYVSDSSNNRLRIIDITDPTTPVMLSNYGTTASYPWSVTVQGHIAYITTTGGNNMQMFDVSDPATSVPSIGTVSGGSYPTGITVDGRYAYVTYYSTNTTYSYDVGGAYLQQLEAGGIETASLSVLNDLAASRASFRGGVNIGNSLNVQGDVGISGSLSLGVNNPAYQLQLSTDSAAKPVSGTWTVASDRRLKGDIQDFTDGLAVIEQINPVSYELNGRGGMPDGAKGIGVIAQDVKDVVPYTISTFRAKYEPEDEETTEFYSFNSSALTFVLINAVKELDANIEELNLSKDGLLGGNSTELNMEGKPIVDVSALSSSGGLWSIDGEGRLTSAAVDTEKVTTESVAVRQTDEHATIDGSVIPSGENFVQVYNPAIDPSVRIFVTFRGYMGGAWWVNEISEGFFVLQTRDPVVEDTPFDYWIVDVEDQRTVVEDPFKEASSSGEETDSGTGESISEESALEPVTDTQSDEEPAIDEPAGEEPIPSEETAVTAEGPADEQAADIQHAEEAPTDGNVVGETTLEMPPAED